MLVVQYFLERVLLSLPKDEEGRSEVSLMLTAFSLVVGGNFDELINTFFRINTKNGATMTNAELEDFIGGESILNLFCVFSDYYYTSAA